MPNSGNRRWRAWIVLHGAFAAVAVLVLLLPAPAEGMRVLGLVLLYHAGALVAARRDPTLWQAWTVLAPFSVIMVLPDWFLSSVLGILRFPDTGGPFIGTVPLAMAGMWTIALMPVVGAGIAAQDRGGRGVGTAVAAATGFALFVAAEFAAPRLGLWEPVGVAMIGGVATYVIVPELILSGCAYLVVSTNGALPRPATAALTVLLPFTYLGLLASSYQFLG